MLFRSEKTYAAGKIPGGFFKRETKPSDFETLTSRIVDRSLRPLFPDGFGHPTQITIMVFSADEEADLQVLALNAASAALFTSDIDVNTSVSAVRTAKVDGELILNPTLSQLKNSTLDLYLSGTKDDLLMIEMRSFGSNGSSNAMPEDDLVEVFERTQELLFYTNAKYENAFLYSKKETLELDLKHSEINEEMLVYVKENHMSEIFDAMNQMAKSER